MAISPIGRFNVVDFAVIKITDFIWVPPTYTPILYLIRFLFPCMYTALSLTTSSNIQQIVFVCVCSFSLILFVVLVSHLSNTPIFMLFFSLSFSFR